MPDLHATPPAVAIVTGGSRGIGRAIVERLAGRGHPVLVVFSADVDGADRLVAEHRNGPTPVPLLCDITADDAPARILDAAETLGDVGILVNNAGITGPIGPLRDATDATIRRVIDVDLTATIRLSRECVARWDAKTEAGRSIVNVSSVAARTGAAGEYVWYAAAKAGVNAFTVGLARELGHSGIRVNAVNAGTTDTTIHATAGRPQRAAEVGARTPLGRPARADEIAAAVEWLSSAEAGYVTGSVLDVTGGV